MVYMEHGMWEILEVLRRHHRGENNVKIAKSTHRSRNTVKRYLVLATRLGWQRSQEPTEAIALEVFKQLRPGPSLEKLGSVEKILQVHRERISLWLSPSNGTKGLKLTKVHQLLQREAVVVSYASLFHFAKKYCEFRQKKHTVRLAESTPGEIAEVDFGRLGLVYDNLSGLYKFAHALIITLTYSRHQYVQVSFSQKLQDLIRGLENAWFFFGGTPQKVILDNMKCAIAKADRYDPVFSRVLNEYAEYRAITLDPAVVRHPTGKAQVERNVQYVRENFFRGQEWLNLEQVQREVIKWCLEVAGTRKHGTTLKCPLQEFEDVEKSTLRPLLKERFDPPQWAECKVHPDHHIQFHKALYSVPTQFVGKSVSVRGDKSLVRIYYQGEQIKIHQTVASGKRATDFDDYPKEQSAYARREPKRMIESAQELGPAVGLFMERLLGKDCPWYRLRQAQKLLRLANLCGSARLNEACHRANAFQIENVKQVESILRLGLKAQTEPFQEAQVIPIQTRFMRPQGSFSEGT